MSELPRPGRYLFQLRVLVLMFVMAGPLAFAQQAGTLSLVMGTSPALKAAKAPLPTFLDDLAHAIFTRLGIEITLTALPAERALINVNTGLDDGDMFRPEGIDSLYPNLIKVPERVLDYEFVAYTKRADIQIHKIEDLKPYIVGFPNGWKKFELRFKQVSEITMTTSIDELYPLIDKDRVDVIIIGRYGGKTTVDKQALALHLIAHEPPLIQADMFIYLNKKHAALLPRVAQALKDIKADGSYKKILDATLNRAQTP
jgi:polar amino acid transport system substrate-binding protein